MKVTNSSQRLKELLNLTGDSQMDMARKTNIPKSSISHYINGEREPRQDKLSQISEAYNVNPAWLMGLDVPMDSLETLESKMVKNRLDFLFLEEDNIPELEQNQADFKKNKENYERVKEFVKLFNNATPEAKTLVENFLKSSQQ